MDSGAVDTAKGAPEYRGGPFKFDASLEPEAPRVGENRVVIDLRDQGNPVSEAEVHADAMMPAMATMAEMHAPMQFREAQPGRYVGTFDLSMSGEWPLTLDIRREGMGRHRISFDMATGRTGLQVVSGAMTDDEMEEIPPGTVTVDSRRRQVIGLELGKAAYRDLARTIRAVGLVKYDERRLSDVSLRFDAWIGELEANYVGKDVKRGEVLFTVYGPELLAAHGRTPLGQASLRRPMRDAKPPCKAPTARIRSFESSSLAFMRDASHVHTRSSGKSARLSLKRDGAQRAR